jgi:hypothetical protein
VIVWANLIAAPDGRITATQLSQPVEDALYPQ